MDRDGVCPGFGSLLLLGGRLSDIFGRKWAFVGGLMGFALASAVGGAAQSFEMLVGARTLQGIFGAILAPAVLALLSTTFTDPSERRKAFAIYGAIAGAGGALGLLLGGVLTEYLSWRWCLYVNLVFAVPAAVSGVVLLRNVHPAVRPRFDLPSPLTASLGLLALVYGFTTAETDGWGAGVTLACLGAAVVLLSAFVAIQLRSANPLLPMRVVADRDRGGAYLAVAIVGAGMFGVFLFLTYYLQQSLGFSPIETGLGFLPMILALSATAMVAQTRIAPRTGPKPLIVIGMLAVAGGMLLLTQLQVDSSYATAVLPGLIVLGVGIGLAISTGISNATLGVQPRDAGVASAMVNTGQQVGGSIGTALLSTLAASAASSFVAAGDGSRAQAAVHGYTTAFWWSAAIFGMGAVVTALLLRHRRPELELEPVAEAESEPALVHA